MICEASTSVGIISSKREEDWLNAPDVLERLCGGRDVEEWREEEVEDDWEEVRSFSSSLCGWTSMGVL